MKQWLLIAGSYPRLYIEHYVCSNLDSLDALLTDFLAYVEMRLLLPELQGELLRARVDPNKFVRKASMSPLLIVISRARPEHLEEMRDALIENGAEYGVEERRRYKSRYDSDQYDPIYLREFHKSATSYYTALEPPKLCNIQGCIRI